MNLNNHPIKAFLDALDTVLNSNSFLLETSVNFEDPHKTLEDTMEFIRCGEFEKQVLEQDLLRNWGNYHRNGIPVKTSGFIKPDFLLKLNQIPAETVIGYLRNMLTVAEEQTVFWSPYKKQIGKDKAQQLVLNFLDGLMLQMNWKAFQLNTDFSYTRTERAKSKDQLVYFEGDFGSDSATLFIREDNSAFLLLTNGRD